MMITKTDDGFQPIILVTSVIYDQISTWVCYSLKIILIWLIMEIESFVNATAVTVSKGFVEARTRENKWQITNKK